MSSVSKKSFPLPHGQCFISASKNSKHCSNLINVQEQSALINTPSFLHEETCKQLVYEGSDVGGLLSSPPFFCTLPALPSPRRLFGFFGTRLGRLFWRFAGSSLAVVTTRLCRQVWMFCQHPSIYDRSQMWVQEHTVLYPNPEINETWLPSRPQIPKCECVRTSVCVCVCMTEKRNRGIKGVEGF